ncbi:MAG: homoserine kinase [Kaiparowitsia implicata GSE-PSE-MK54-09C]|jgi:homoserine kinase|nr:homoserine kinase [Kaiparowitsia implicata GSE-PSE-MK54-09C]
MVGLDTGLASVTVRVPGTTANIGPGFDCLGAALTLYNQFTFTRHPAGERLQISVSGQESAQVVGDKSNLAYRAFCHLFTALDLPLPPLRLEIGLDVPLARGLGSSATAIVGGLVGANALAGSPLNEEEVMQMAIALEGHPDNVVPALLGGCRLAAAEASAPTWAICDVPWHPDLVPVVAIPDFELSTQAARRVLPASYARADAIFNMAHLGLLLRALGAGNPDWLNAALHDRIHQPYRKALIKGYDAVEQGAIAAGAYGLVISGAGPTLLAIAPPTQAQAVATAMQTAWAAEQVTAEVRVLGIDTQGTQIRAIATD